MWDPDSVSSDQLNELRSAAEQAWGDDTRHPNYVGHPQPSAGQCYVTSAWLQSKLGGHVASKDGHYFWVSPDRSHVVDLTGDQFAYEPADPSVEGAMQDDEDEPWLYEPEQQTYRPGPVMYKRADHPLWKGFRVVSKGRDFSKNPRARLFAQRANAALSGQTVKTADLLGADAYPGSTLEKQEADAMPVFPGMVHDEPDYTPDDRPQQYKFVFINGELHLSPIHDHEQLAHHARIDDNGEGPAAIGWARVKDGHVSWTVHSNVGSQSMYDILAHYSREVGWQFDGLTGQMEQPVQRYWYRVAADGHTVELASAPLGHGCVIDVIRDTAYVSKSHPGVEEWAADRNLKVAEVPGGGNMLDKMRHREDLEMFNRQDPHWDPEPTNTDVEPEGPFSCPHCNFKPKTFGELRLHMDEHQPKEDVIEDGHFPQVNDFDEPLPLRSRQPYPEMAWNGVQAKVMVLPNSREARRIPEFELYSNLFGFEREGHIFYGAYLSGQCVGYAVVRPSSTGSEVMMIQSSVPNRGVGSTLLNTIKRHYDYFYSHADTPGGEALMRKNGMVNVHRHRWVYSAGQEPKDMIESEVPFIYDIKNDKLELGYPGTTTHDINGQFTPGGIVEGLYAPGGKITIQTASTWPFSVRHMLDLWYYTAPQMRITGVEQIERDGSSTKLADAGQHVGQYMRTLVASDPAATNAYRALRNAGGSTNVVGGAVRDALLGRVPNDLDFMVGGLSESEILHALKQLPGSAIQEEGPLGKKFGMFRYKVNGHEVEIAMPRSDTYETGRRGEGDIKTNPDMPVEEDLERRDFTANSMAVNLDTGALIDPYGGAQDIERGVLRTTHPNSFREDPTRIIRAMTAHGRFGLVPDERTRHEMEDNAHLLRGESPDTLNKTLTKLFKSANPASAIRLGQETGALSHIFPEVGDQWDFDQKNPHHRLSLGEHQLHALDNMSRITTDPDQRLAALLHDIGKPASQWVDANGVAHYYQSDNQGQMHEDVGAKMAEDRLRALNYPTARINRIRHMIQHHMFAPFNTPKGARKFINRVGDEHADAMLNLREADQTGKGQTPEELAARTQAGEMRDLVGQARQSGAPTDLSMMSVNGNDLIQMGMKPGPAIGQVLQQLSNDVLEDPSLNHRDLLMQRAQQYMNAQPPESLSGASF